MENTLTHSATSSSTAPIVSQSYDVSDFTSIDNNIDASVVFTQSAGYSVVVSAQQFILDILSVTVKNSKLVIKFTQHMVPTHLPVTVTIAAPQLASFYLDGSGSFTAAGSISSDSLTLEINGAGNIKVAGFTGQSLTGNVSGSGNITVSGGSAPTQSVTISGSGNIDFSGASAANATTNTSGFGNITVRVSDTLNVKISGNGNVYYYGSPVVTSKITGFGKVQQLS